MEYFETKTNGAVTTSSWFLINHLLKTTISMHLIHILALCIFMEIFLIKKFLNQVYKQFGNQYMVVKISIYVHDLCIQ